ncbi:hypothetical protein A1O1_03220 [Capronia coronata CBS 617.96]|uniref:Aminodeoxychorismate lyase n=1 Tax=Capronia coronata CBS 617.96 TaxID=1182541 RepID=W9YPH2_9EURO|nr:uncharacterized protein A1O1_03220 [Capronia coronata CBS 617.96]EXJ94822.1 hypothetical protein A1O1_03220 [Capronia coronata CBS 617.96]
MGSEGVAVILQDPSFRILTTLKYIHFNDQDVAEFSQLVGRWKQEESKSLRFHRQRLRAAAQACSWAQVSKQFESDDAALDLLRAIEQAITKELPEPGHGCIKEIRVRVLVDGSGHVDVETVPMGNERPVRCLVDDGFYQLPTLLSPSSPSNDSGAPFSKVYVDFLPTRASIFTAHKTTYRQAYNQARSRAEIVHAAPTDAEVLLFNSRREITEASLSTPYFFREGGWVTPAVVSGGMLSVTKLRASQGGFCTERLVTLDELRHGEMIWLSNAVRGFFRGMIYMKDHTAKDWNQ